MSNVTVHLHLEEENASPHVFTRIAGDPHATSEQPLTFKSMKLIHDGHSRVYKGHMSVGQHQGLDVVCKLARKTDKSHKRFQREADVYMTKLRDMQGLFIPRFYGLYIGDISGEPTICIILEDCGTSISNMADLSMQWRYVLLSLT